MQINIQFHNEKVPIFLFQVNLEGNKLRRQLPIGDIPHDTDSRTVYVVKIFVFIEIFKAQCVQFRDIWSI